MKIYFKEAIGEFDFDYIINNFDGVEYIEEEETEMGKIYKEVMFETEGKYIDNEEWEVIDWFLKDGYTLSWSSLDMKYYLT